MASKLYFTRARDFGFSKNSEETEKIWGDPSSKTWSASSSNSAQHRDQRWGGVHGGHGHHHAFGYLDNQAVK